MKYGMAYGPSIASYKADFMAPNLAEPEILKRAPFFPKQDLRCEVIR